MACPPPPTRCILLAALALFLAGCGAAGGLTTEPAVVDFGPVHHGAVRTARVRLVNEGTTDVTFQAKVSCACFALGGGYRNVLGPGESVDLDLRFDSAREVPGPLAKYLEISSSEDDGQREIKVPLRAEIVRVLDVSGTQIRLGQLDGGPQDLVARTAEFRPTQGYTIEIEKIDTLGADSAHLTFTPQATSVAGALLVDVAVRPEAQRAIGVFEAAARVHFKLKAPDGSSFALAEVIRVEGFWARPAPR